MQYCPLHGDHRVIQYASIIAKTLYLFVFISIDIQLILITGCLLVFIIISVLVIWAKVGSIIVEGSIYKSKTKLGH